MEQWNETNSRVAALLDVVLLDIGGTLVVEHAPMTPTNEMVPSLLENVARDLQVLSHIVRLGAATNTAVMRESEVRALLATVGIDEYMEVVVTSCDVGAAKPDPAVLFEANRRLSGFDPGRILYIGDRDTDAEAAARAGMHYKAVGPRGILAALLDWIEECRTDVACR